MKSRLYDINDDEFYYYEKNIEYKGKYFNFLKLFEIKIINIYYITKTRNNLEDLGFTPERFLEYIKRNILLSKLKNERYSFFNKRIIDNLLIDLERNHLKYVIGSNPNPIINDDIKKLAATITPQKIEQGESIFDKHKKVNKI